MVDQALLATDITDGAKRLAQELDQYITTGSRLSTPASGHVDLSLSNDAIADLQLATARKLREVRWWNVLPLSAAACVVASLAAILRVQRNFAF
jgi:hypothetical protein